MPILEGRRRHRRHRARPPRGPAIQRSPRSCSCRTFAEQVAIAIENARLVETIDRQRTELARFVSPQIAALVSSAEGEQLLAGHRRQITAVFADLRGFTHFRETAEPEELLGVLRAYHGAMGALVVEHGGTLEHFAGDGMLVFFNDPVIQDDHAQRAVAMAIAMRARFAELAEGWHKLGYELGLGIGISTGYATLGRIGFEGRYDYAAIGNAVILASRLSTEAKAGQILLGQRTYAAVEGVVEVERRGRARAQGHQPPGARPISPCAGPETTRTKVCAGPPRPRAASARLRRPDPPGHVAQRPCPGDLDDPEDHQPGPDDDRQRHERVDRVLQDDRPGDDRDDAPARGSSRGLP